MIEQFFRFCVVGASGAVIDFGLTFLLKEKGKMIPYLANAFGFTLAATCNYIFNRFWTFQSHSAAIGFEYGLFILFSVVGLFINTLVLHLFTTRFSIPFFNPDGKLRFYIAKAIAVGVVTFWNFGMNFFFTFAK